MDIFSPDQDLMFVIVNGQFAHGIRPRSGNFIISRGSAGVPDRSADPGQQFICAKGLGQIVVCAQVQRIHLVLLVRAGGDHDHRQAGPAANAAEDLHAVHIGKPQIQNHKVRTMRGND